MSDTPEIPADEAVENRMTTEQINAILADNQIPADEVRPAALPEYDGASDEHILAGGVSAAEAFELFKRHYDTDTNRAIGLTVVSISPAKVAGRPVWLPRMSTQDEARKHWRNESARLTRELDLEKGRHASTKSDLQDEEWRTKALNLCLVLALFDDLEGKESPLREKFREDAIANYWNHGGHYDIEKYQEMAATIIGDWMEHNPLPPKAARRRKTAKRPVKAKKASARKAALTKARRKRPQSKRGR